MISQLIQENRIPEFGELSTCGVTSRQTPMASLLFADASSVRISLDNFYLDMNGIIHNCSHPNDGDAHFRITEAQIFLAIFAYIDHLFSKIKPKKLFCEHAFLFHF
jgi:5'-3' exonuclease